MITKFSICIRWIRTCNKSIIFTPEYSITQKLLFKPCSEGNFPFHCAKKKEINQHIWRITGVDLNSEFRKYQTKAILIKSLESVQQKSDKNSGPLTTDEKASTGCCSWWGRRHGNVYGLKQNALELISQLPKQLQEQRCGRMVAQEQLDWLV